MDVKKLIKLQNAIIRAHQKINDVQSDSNIQTTEIKNEFKKEFNSLNKALEQLNKELNGFTKKEESNKQNVELERLKGTLDKINKNIDDKISKIQLKHGKDGINGIDGKDGINGKDGRDGKNGKDGKDGANGLSAYEIAVKQGYEGTEEEWIEHITNNGGRSYDGQIAAMNQRVNKVSRTIKTDGNGDKYLADDGTYKTVSGSGEVPEDVLTKTSIAQTIEECEQCTGELVPAAGLLATTYSSIPRTVSQLENDSGFLTEEAIESLNNSKFIIKEYDTYDDLPKPLISYSYSTSFDYQWGPSEDYYYYENGKWVTDIEGIGLSIENTQYSYTQEDLANVTCKITSELPTDLYPDITEDSFSLNMAYSNIDNLYISAAYYPVLTTSYGDYEYNPCTLGLNLSFDIILPPKANSEVVEGVIYKVLDTNKCYILDTNTYEWIEFDGSTLDFIPAMNFIDRIKQDKLVSGQNIATINGQSLLNSGDLSLVTSSSLSNYLLKSYVKNARSTASNGYVYDVRYINNMIKTSRTTSSYNTYDCTYINGLVKTSRNTSSYNTYSCNYINNNFLTLDTLPKWDGGNE